MSIARHGGGLLEKPSQIPLLFQTAIQYLLFENRSDQQPVTIHRADAGAGKHLTAIEVNFIDPGLPPFIQGNP